jgi:hypothetical protein
LFDPEYGINLVNTGTGDFEVSYVRAFCRDGESANDRTTRGFGAGIRTAPESGNAIVDTVIDSITVTGGSGNEFFSIE